jgi:hypothetical protein
MTQLRDEAKASIIDGLIAAANQAGFENPRITFIYGVGTENLATEEHIEYYQVHVTAQVTEGYTEPNHKFFAVTGTTYCYDRADVICTLAVGLDDLKVNTKDDAYDYANHDHEPVIDALAEVIGYFYDEAQLPYHWHRVFETA